MAQQGVSPRPGSAWPAWLAEAECLAGARAGAAARLGQRPAAISGHGSASKRAQEVCETMAKASRQLSRVEKGRKGSPTAAEHGSAMAVGGEARGSSPWARKAAQARA